MKIKKVLVIGTCMMMLMSTTLVSQAATSNFTLTVTTSGQNQDTLSKRTVKDGGSSYENKCYVRPTGFRGTGTVGVKSIQLNNSAISSSEISLGSASSVNQLRSASYNRYAASGKYYYLKARLRGASTSSVNVTGRYTP